MIEAYAAQWRNEEQVVAAIVVDRGGPGLEVVPMNSDGLILRTVPREEERYMRRLPSEHFTKDLEHFEDAAKKFGATDRVRALLHELSRGEL